MSLSGSVEDLPLLEILQVVSFCQKTGHLMVKADAGEAAVVFDSGRVVAGYAWDVEPLPPQHPAPGPERERVVRDRIAGILEKLVRLRDGTFAFTLNQQGLLKDMANENIGFFHHMEVGGPAVAPVFEDRPWVMNVALDYCLANTGNMNNHPCMGADNVKANGNANLEFAIVMFPG